MKFWKQEKFVWSQIEDKNLNILNSAALPTTTALMYQNKIEMVEKSQNIKNKEIEDKYGAMETIEEQVQLEKRDHQQFSGEVNEPKTQIHASKLIREDKDELKNKEVAEAQEDLKRQTEELLAKEGARGGHDHIWGSWWNKELGWGYKCCYSTNRYERCLGEEAKRLAVLKEYQIKLKSRVL